MDANKRIVINTGVLYSRLIITTIIGIISSRIILDALGASDYGLYSVVGGIVTFLNVIGTTMVSVSYRFLAVELGKDSEGDANKVYNTVYVIHLVLAFFLIIIGETLGLYYVNNILNVAANKLHDAQFILHVSLFTTAISVMSVPANGLIIAKEKFVFTTITEIGVSIIKLCLLIWLSYFQGNRLRVYALIIAGVTIVTRFAYLIYCRKNATSIVKWNFNNRWSDYKAVFFFACWSLFGAVATIGKEQGSAMIINFFFGTSINASYGIASQVNSYILTFSKSLNQAAVPQIMKSYGGGDQKRSLNIVYAITRLSTLIMLIIVVPLMLCLDDVLRLWLKDVPEYTSIFTSWMLISGVVMVLGSGFDPCIQSTGNIKSNEIGYGLINLALLPIIYVLYKLGCPPYVNVIVSSALAVVTRMFQVFIMKKQTNFQFLVYFKYSLLPSFLTIIVSFVPLLCLRLIWGHSVIHTITYFLIGVLWTVFSIWMVGIKNSERQMIVSELRKKFVH